MVSAGKTTIKDIARATGVSTTTVINVLRDRVSQTSPATAERVRKKAKQLGYVRNLTAASLVSRRSHAIALVIVHAYDPKTPQQESDINPFYGELILRLERVARRAGYMLNLYGGNEEDYVDFILQRNVDAAVLLGIRKPELPGLVARQGVPVILIDSAFRGPRYMHVRTDEVAGGEISAEHLIRRGCRTLAFLGSIDQPAGTVSSLRRQGAERACKRHGRTLQALHRNARYEQGLAAAADAVKLGVDGIVAASDTLAIGMIHGLIDAGRRVPDDVAVVGYDNVAPAPMMRPALTTVDQELGQKVEAILHMVEGGKPGSTKIVTPRLVIRESA